MSQPPSIAERIDPPSLQKLVEDHGGYDKIPESAWKQFDLEMEAWKADVRSGSLHRR
jgi:hypothetical protein